MSSERLYYTDAYLVVAVEVVDRHVRLIAGFGLPVVALLRLFVVHFFVILAQQPVLHVRPEGIADRGREREPARLRGVLEDLAEEETYVPIAQAGDGGNITVSRLNQLQQ